MNMLAWTLSLFLSNGTSASSNANRRRSAHKRPSLSGPGAGLSGDALGNFAQAKAELDSCLVAGPTIRSVWKSWLDWAMAADQVELARQALRHVPAQSLDEAQTLKLRAWFAACQAGSREPSADGLTQLLAIDPGQSSALTRLAELALQAGDEREAEAFRRKKTELNTAFDRFNRLYREDRYAEHLEELAQLAERLGRRFEARAFWELVRLQSPSNAGAAQALARLVSSGPAPSPFSGSLADLLGDEIGPVAHPVRDFAKNEGARRGAVPTFEDRAPGWRAGGFRAR